LVDRSQSLIISDLGSLSEKMYKALTACSSGDDFCMHTKDGIKKELKNIKKNLLPMDQSDG
jgi:hypothetical protein